jgi:hypothetical protein
MRRCWTTVPNRGMATQKRMKEMSGSNRLWFDPDFCESGCPVCTRARKGNRFARFLQGIEMIVTFGGCPWGRARQKKYGVRPSESLPGESTEAR